MKNRHSYNIGGAFDCGFAFIILIAILYAIGSSGCVSEVDTTSTGATTTTGNGAGGSSSTPSTPTDAICTDISGVAAPNGTPCGGAAPGGVCVDGFCACALECWDGAKGPKGTCGGCYTGSSCLQAGMVAGKCETKPLRTGAGP